MKTILVKGSLKSGKTSYLIETAASSVKNGDNVVMFLVESSVDYICQKFCENTDITLKSFNNNVVLIPFYCFRETVTQSDKYIYEILQSIEKYEPSVVMFDGEIPFSFALHVKTYLQHSNVKNLFFCKQVNSDEQELHPMWNLLQ